MRPRVFIVLATLRTPCSAAPRLQDGFNQAWDATLVSALVRERARQHKVDMVRDPVVADYGRIAACVLRRWRVPDAISVAAAAPVALPLLVQVVTFDERGISGHPNHIGVHHGVAKYARTPNSAPCYELKTVMALRKFTGVLDALASAVATAGVSRGNVASAAGKVVPQELLFTSWKPWKSHAAMAAHWSQYVWFRRLFVLFSRYTFVNTLSLMRASRD
jgi:hypothetical protein